MKLIGIYLYEKTPKVVRRNLKEGWYPFIQEYEHNGNGLVSSRGNNHFVNSLYKTSETGPKIFLHAIVGKNGSGKSAILEVLYRIINNLAVKVLSKIDRLDSATLILTKNLYATLSLEVDGKIKYLKIEGENVYIENNVGAKKQITNISHIDYLRDFFYTISINYSHYALNVRDYDNDDEVESPKSKRERSNSQHWLNGISHKNDGYLTPIVLSPMRTEGNIDINKEEKLSKERLIGLLLLLKKDGVDFLDGYKACSLQISFDLKKTLDKRNENMAYWKKNKSNGHYVYLSLFQLSYFYWEEILREKKILKDVHNSIQESILNYLAYKAISISSKYPLFSKIVKLVPDDRITLRKKNQIPTLINEIYGDKSHVTLKVRQCINLLKNIDRELYYEVAEKEKVTLCVEYFIQKFLPIDKEYTIDEVFEVLPPPIFKVDIYLKIVENNNELSTCDQQIKDKFNVCNNVNENLIRLTKMSSGERQMLYSLSAVMYHLKNIQSIKESMPDNYRSIKYRHVNIILDEVEMYYHPEYQRQFVKKFLDLINRLRLKDEDIKSINICLVTHSPFVLSDVLKKNILFLEDGNVVNYDVKEETFGANMYDILRNGFFLKDNALGCFVNDKINEVLSIIKKDEHIGDNEQRAILTKEEIIRAKNLIKLIGDPFIKGYLLTKIEDICID